MRSEYIDHPLDFLDLPAVTTLLRFDLRHDLSDGFAAIAGEVVLEHVDHVGHRIVHFGHHDVHRCGAALHP